MHESVSLAVASSATRFRHFARLRFRLCQATHSSLQQMASGADSVPMSMCGRVRRNIAESILRLHAKGSDDSLVLVARYLGGDARAAQP